MSNTATVQTAKKVKKGKAEIAFDVITYVFLTLGSIICVLHHYFVRFLYG